MSKSEKAFKLFDDFNRQDPNILIVEGAPVPTEYFHALQLCNWVKKLDPEPSEALLLASRSQHIGRWTSARTSYPDGKAGYLQWRMDLARFHASKAAELLQEAGYEASLIYDVQQIILKKDLKNNPDVQTMENALCLVFLQFQYEDFLHKHDEQKVIRVIKKSWNKMSQPGKDQAFTIEYSSRGKELLEKALQ